MELYNYGTWMRLIEWCIFPLSDRLSSGRCWLGCSAASSFCCSVALWRCAALSLLLYLFWDSFNYLSFKQEDEVRVRCQMKEPHEEESDKNSSGGSDEQGEQTCVITAGNASLIKKSKGRRVVQWNLFLSIHTTWTSEYIWYFKIVPCNNSIQKINASFLCTLLRVVMKSNLLNYPLLALAHL